jgi:hypothetical protein
VATGLDSCVSSCACVWGCFLVDMCVCVVVHAHVTRNVDKQPIPGISMYVLKCNLFSPAPANLNALCRHLPTTW